MSRHRGGARTSACTALAAVLSPRPNGDRRAAAPWGNYLVRKRSRFLDRLVYELLRLLGAVARMFPFRMGITMAMLFADLVFYLDRRHRQVTIENLRLSFPGHSESELHALARRVFRHFSILTLELHYIPRRIYKANWHRYVTGTGIPTMRKIAESGRPVVIVGGHFGNWELAAHVFGLNDIAGYLVARPLDNPFIDRDFRRMRERTGMKVLDKVGSLMDMVTILRNHGVVCLLADQDAGPRGKYVEFFGRPASTSPVVEMLARATDAIIVVAACRRGPRNFEFIGEVADVIPPEEYRGREEVVNQRVATALESLIRRAPEQYFWLHRRWKSQPQPPKLRAA